MYAADAYGLQISKQDWSDAPLAKRSEPLSLCVCVCVYICVCVCILKIREQMMNVQGILIYGNPDCNTKHIRVQVGDAMCVC